MMSSPSEAHLLSDMFTFYTTREYFDELIIRTSRTKKGDRVLLMSMLFNPTEPAIAALTRELQRAAARGVYVSLAVDAYAFLLGQTNKPGPLLSRKKLPKYLTPYYKNKLNLLESINTLPTGNATIINIPKRGFSLPVAGRSHIKIALINDDIFMGGCNLQQETWIDMMIGWKSRDTANKLYGLMQKIIDAKHVAEALGEVDRCIPIEGDAEFLIDSGVPGQSLILDEALRLIDSANKWLVITCQFFPNSITARHLLEAIKRGVKVEVIFSHPRHHGLIGGLGQHVSILRERSRLPKVLFEQALSRNDPMLHAKLIASDGGVMIGSHNYVSAGVILGTAEIAFKSQDNELAKEAVTTLHRGLRRST